MKILFTLFIALLTSTLHSQTGSISGVVVDHITNSPIANAAISLVEDNSISTVSDQSGKFYIEGVSAGYHSIIVSSLGYQLYRSESDMLTADRDLYLEVAMFRSSIELDEISVAAPRFRKKTESPLSYRVIGVKEIDRDPGGNRDISKVVQSYPGVASSVGYRNDLIVRGGGPSENSFFIDDIEIPTVNHFTTQGASGGPVGMINVDLIKGVEFYSGAFPIDQSKSLSSVLGFKVKSGNREKLESSFVLGSSDLAIAMDGPLGDKTTFNLSVRRSYLQFLMKALNLPILPTYNDMQFKVEHQFNPKLRLSVLGIGAIDNLELNLDVDDESGRAALDNIPTNDQYNYTVGSTLRQFGETSSNSVTVSYSYLNNQAEKYIENIEIEDNLILDYSSDESRTDLKYHYDSDTFKAGAEIEFIKYSDRVYQKIYQDGVAIDQTSDSSISFTNYSIWGGYDRSFFYEKLSISLGVRAIVSDYNQNMGNILDQISPKISASYILSDRFILNGSAGIYYQQPELTTMGYQNSTGEYENREGDLSFIRANNISIGTEFISSDNNLSISVEGFYKYYSEYPVSIENSVSLANIGADFGTVGNEAVRSIGNGRAYGAEFQIRYSLPSKLSANLSYTLVNSEFTDLYSNYIPSSWDNRNIVAATGGYEFDKDIQVGVKWRYQGGSPYTPYDIESSANKEYWDLNGEPILIYDSYNSLRLDPFNQLDIRIDKEWFYDSWSLMLYLDLQNILGTAQDSPPTVVAEVDADGDRLTDPSDPTKYILKTVDSGGGSIIPTIGIIVEL